MSLLVVGSVALDNIEAPEIRVYSALGGSAVHFSTAASKFVKPRLVGVVGRDFPERYHKMVASVAEVDGLEVADGDTFHWWGRYEGDMSQAITHDVKLNVLAGFKPRLPRHWRDSRYVFLANAGPKTQMSVLRQLKRPKLVVADTMNLWIQNERKALLRLMKKIDGLVLNDAEARMLSGEACLMKACAWISKHGPKLLVVKKGEHGALLSYGKLLFPWPAYPTDEVYDPTGAGDSFAGGFMGYIATQRRLGAEVFKRAVVYGQVVASFNVEGVGIGRLLIARPAEIRRRLRRFVKSMSVKWD